MSSQEKPKSISEILSESCSKKEYHSEYVDRPCPECGHVDATPGSAQHLEAVYHGIKEREEKKAQSPDNSK